MKVLDRAAARCESIDLVPATAKQTWFLAGLIAKGASAEADYQDFLLNSNLLLTKREASSLIDSYLN